MLAGVAIKALEQLGVQRDLGVEDLGDRAVFLGVFRHLREFAVVKVRHLGAQGQSRTTDAKSFTLLLEGDGRLGAELGRGKSRLLQAKRKRQFFLSLLFWTPPNEFFHIRAYFHWFRLLLPRGFGFENCASLIHFRVFQHTARRAARR
jgi:hypothetical protein